MCCSMKRQSSIKQAIEELTIFPWRKFPLTALIFTRVEVSVGGTAKRSCILRSRSESLIKLETTLQRFIGAWLLSLLGLPLRRR